MYWKDDWTGFFVVYFKWSYYLCLTPFRLHWEKKEKRYRLEKNRFQSVLCALVYIFLALWYFKDLRKIPLEYLKHNPDAYFSLAFNLNAIFYHNIILVTYFWRRQRSFLSLVNFDSDRYSGSTKMKRIQAELLCFLFALLPVFYTFIGYRIVETTTICSPLMVFRCLVAEGRFAFFANESIHVDQPCNRNQPPTFEEISWVDVVLAVLTFFMEWARQVVGFYSDFFPLICCFSLYTCIGSIKEVLDDHGESEPKQKVDYPYNNISFNYHQSNNIQDDCINVGKSGEDENRPNGLANGGIALSSKSPVGATSTPALPLDGKKELSSVEAGECVIAALKGNVLLERYEVCKAFSKRINKALGLLLFAYVLSSIMYLSTCMDAVLILEDWYGKFRVAFFFFIFILMFFIGSEIVNKVYSVRDWLSDPLNNAFLSQKNLMVLIHEISNTSIGISGNGMVTVTYSAFMTVMTTTVTFFIIILQFQKPESGA